MSETLTKPSADTPSEKASDKDKANDKFHEAMVIMDDTTWIWQVTGAGLDHLGSSYVRLPSQVTVRHSWSRFRTAPCIVIHWESRSRPGGAIIEEILDVDPKFDVAHKIIVLTTNPIHEDVVYFSELGIRRVVRMRNRDKDLEKCRQEIEHHAKEAANPNPRPTVEILWRKVLSAIDRLPSDELDPALLNRIDDNIRKLRGTNAPAARDLDAMASVYFRRGNREEAKKYWELALANNPNYFRAYNNLIAFHRALGEQHEAYALMQKMQLLNRSSIARLVAMGETQLELNDERKAEHYFKSALEKDAWCSGALNGLAEIRFRTGDLDTARDLLEKSSLAYRYAAKLNLAGIDMVKAQKYADALEHYSKAQYVLPQQEKGPQLFYNIGLCYARWGKNPMAKEFLKLALIKEPNYKKAQRLLDQVQQIAASTASNQDEQNHQTGANSDKSVA